MITTKTLTIYEVGNFNFDNLKDAENFNRYLDIFSDEQLKELYSGFENKIDYTIYANAKFNANQMRQIRDGLEEGIDVSWYAKPEFDWKQMNQIRLGLQNNVDVSL